MSAPDLNSAVSAGRSLFAGVSCMKQTSDSNPPKVSASVVSLAKAVASPRSDAIE